MRRGELCGLKWDNVDLDKGIVYVKNQLQTIDNVKKTVPLKTAGTKRKLILLDYTIPILKEWKEKQQENKKICRSKG
jgi:integrase